MQSIGRQCDRRRPELRKVPGFVGAYLSRRQLGRQIEFLVLTRWQSMDAIRGFAGDDTEKAVVGPAAIAALVEFDSAIHHYVVIDEVARS
jgi:heme-degrading monooxygenase HmoA